MKRYPLIANFDGAKFAARYSLDAIRGDFFVDSERMLNVPDNLPDDPPIQEVSDDPTTRLHKTVVALVDAAQQDALLDRAVVAVLLDELNLHATKINSILAAVGAATSLADLKARMALISDYPQRTLQQAKDAIKVKINAGTAD